jgi:HEAT repeats
MIKRGAQPASAGFLSVGLTATASSQDGVHPAEDREAKLLAVLKSNAGEKEKADACRELARVGTKEAVAPLAALLGDEKLSHMARYALEPIPDPAVDDALRDATTRLKGRLLVGVIGSIGVRRDANALDLLKQRLSDTDPEVAQAAARALGSLGSSNAVHALEDSVAGAPAPNQQAIYEGLFRCAESIAAHGKRDDALAIYDRLSAPQVPEAVRHGATKRAHLLRSAPGKKI